MTDDVQRADRKSPTIRNVVIGSVLWLAACGVLFFVADACAVAPDIWSSRVTCLAANEMGDSLAGAFAPLAFLWLIAAVFLQRNELAAQRQELRESRAVAVQQVEEARRNAEFIGQQTKMLEVRHAAERAAGVDVRLEKLVEMLAEKIEALRSRPLVEIPVENVPPGEVNNKRLVVSVNLGQKPFACAAQFAGLIPYAIATFERAYGREPKVVRVPPEQIATIANLAQRADGLGHGVSDLMGDRLAYHGWDNVMPAVQQLVEYIQSVDTNWETAFSEEQLETPP